MCKAQEMREIEGLHFYHMKDNLKFIHRGVCWGDGRDRPDIELEKRLWENEREIRKRETPYWLIFEDPQGVRSLFCGIKE
jgi:hypothetical protein